MGPIKTKWMSAIRACKSVCLDMPANLYWKEFFTISCKLTETGEIKETDTILEDDLKLFSISSKNYDSDVITDKAGVEKNRKLQ